MHQVCYNCRDDSVIICLNTHGLLNTLSRPWSSLPLYQRHRKRTSEVHCTFKSFLDTKTVLTFDPERNLQLTTKFKKLNTVLIFWFISTSYQYSIDRICCKKINVHNVKKISDYILLLTTTKNFVFICFFFVQSHLLSN